MSPKGPAAKVMPSGAAMLGKAAMPSVALPERKKAVSDGPGASGEQPSDEERSVAFAEHLTQEPAALE